MPDKLRVLVVEDEGIVAMLIEDMVAELGHELGAVAARVTDALKAVEMDGFDFAILDVNLAGESSYAVADALAARGVPFVFATGYGTAGLARAYAGVPVLAKPFTRDDLERVLPQEGAA
jgi:CheY-like chemotaxis protein